MQWLYASLAGFLAAVLGALGMGGGGVLLIYLTAFAGTPQIKAQGINLIFFIPIAVVALIFHAKNRLLDYKLALIGVATGIAGVFAGYAAAQWIGDRYLSKAFGVFLLVLGARELFGDLLSRRFGKHKKEKTQKPDD
ncbi:MAG: TSUP family transporter [Acetanaerobacterium sp.]